MDRVIFPAFSSVSMSRILFTTSMEVVREAIDILAISGIVVIVPGGNHSGKYESVATA